MSAVISPLNFEQRGHFISGFLLVRFSKVVIFELWTFLSLTDLTIRLAFSPPKTG